jgi:hypothetical protein
MSQTRPRFTLNHRVNVEVRLSKSRLNSGNTCYYLVQSFLSFHLLSKNVNTEIIRNRNLLLVLYRSET